VNLVKLGELEPVRANTEPVLPIALADLRLVGIVEVQRLSQREDVLRSIVPRKRRTNAGSWSS
jgi:hypothetical protein